jgi:hypothetical protein
MKRVHKCIVLLSVILLTANGFWHSTLADHDDHEGKGHHQRRERRHSGHDCKPNTATATNPVYKENCGACHFAYQPDLLPAGSWDKILNTLSDHFGEAVELDAGAKKAISEHLRSNAAEFSSSGLAASIMRCLGNQLPQRITEISYIQKKHHEINQDILKRESIGSLSNCSACHSTAENGDYDDDHVKIPAS